MRSLFARSFLSFLTAQALLLGILFFTLLIGYEHSQTLWQQTTQDRIMSFARTVLTTDSGVDIPTTEPVFIYDKEKNLIFSNRGRGRMRPLDPSSLAPVTSQGRLVGYISLVPHRFSDDAANTVFLSTMQTAVIIGLASSLVAALVFSFLFSRSLSQPARLLAARLDRMARGDLTSPVPSRGPVEIASIAGSAQRLGRQLAEEKTARARFSDDIAHDLRTPLAALRAQLEGMRDGVLEASPDRLSGNLQELGRLEKMTESLAELMRLEESGYTLHKSMFSVQGLFEELRQAFEPAMQIKRISFLAQTPELTISADRNLLQRTLSNLLSNAVRHADHGGKVNLSAQREGSRTTLTVWNSGPPVPSAELPHVFDRLFRGEYARSTPGSGLGLTIAKQITELHGGTISITSTETEGTEVSVILPDQA